MIDRAPTRSRAGPARYTLAWPRRRLSGPFFLGSLPSDRNLFSPWAFSRLSGSQMSPWDHMAGSTNPRSEVRSSPWPRHPRRGHCFYDPWSTIFTGWICRPDFLPGLRLCREVASGPRASDDQDDPLQVFSDRPSLAQLQSSQSSGLIPSFPVQNRLVDDKFRSVRLHYQCPGAALI